MHNQVIFFTACFIASGLAVSSLEMLKVRSLFSGGLMNWEISRMRSVSLFRSRLLNYIFNETRFPYFAIFRLIAAILLLTGILSGTHILISLGFAWSFLSYILFTLRTPYGLDGSDQAALLVCLVYSILCISQSATIRLACHIFIAAQLTLVYFTSGWNKLKAKDWRNGNYMWKLFSTNFYGMEKLGAFLEKHKAFASFSSLSIILAETFFFLYWLVPAPYCWLILTALGIFHLLTAITMGLNTFLWAFLAMYPSAVYCRLLYS